MVSNNPRKTNHVRPGRAQRALSWMLIVLFAFGQPAFAADQYGQVLFNGVPVPGATVTASQADKKVAASTDADGIFRLVDLAAGVWTLTVEMLGFSTVTRDLTVPTEGAPPPFELTLKSYEQISSELTVQRQEPIPAAPAAGVEQQARGPASTAAAPGAQGAFQRTGVTQAATPRPAGAVAALPEAPADPGGMGAADGLLINGSVNNGASTPFAQPRAFGNARPNQRSLYTYAAGFQFGSSALDARPFSITGFQSARPSYTDVQGLGTFQGPIRIPRLLRNPINVFVGYQGTSDTNAITRSARMPTDLERAGDFSQTVNALGQAVAVIDPTTGRPFEGNKIPGDRISPQAAALVGYYPRAGGSATGRFNFESPILTDTRQDSVQSRAAYQINNRNQINGTVNFQRSVNDSSSLFGFDSSRESSGFDTQGNWSLRISPFMQMRARYQYTRLANESLPYFANRVNVSGDAGIPGNDQSPVNWGPPSLTFASDIESLGDARYSRGTTQTHVAAAEVSRFSGRHNMTFGGEARRHLNDVVGQQDPRGSFAFTGAATGLDFADFLLGLPQTSSIAFGNPDKDFRGQSYAAYFTDDWRLSPSFTLQLGVRWEYESPITEARGRLVNLDVANDFSAVAPVLAGETGAITGITYNDALLQTDKGGLQPRLAMAWRPVPGSSLVVRAGYGLYRNTNVYQSIATLLAQQPPLSTTFNIASTPENPLTLANGFLISGPATTLNTFAVDPEFKVSTAQNWQVSVQRDLPFSLTVAATYLGAKGTNLMQQFLPNTYPAGAANPCQSCPTGFRYLTSGGRSIRNAGQVQLRRRLRNGFTASIQYTLAKAMDNAAAFGGASMDGGALAQNWLDLEAEYAPSNFDQRHLINVTAEYTTGAGITGGTLLDGWKGRLLKDWTFTANLNTGSGMPLTPVFFSPVAGIIGSVRPALTGNTDDTPDGRYANPAWFTAPSPGAWGDAGRNSIRGPKTFSLNAAIARTFRLGDRINMDWRVDATNVLNRLTYTRITTLVTSPEFGLPSSTNDVRKLRTSVRLRF